MPFTEGQGLADVRDAGSSSRFLDARQDLETYVEGLPEDFRRKRGLKSLRDRVQRGISPMSAFAVRELGPLAEKISQSYGAKLEDVLDVAAVMQGGGPWEYAQKFKEGADPAIKAWMALSAACTMVRAREMDLTPEEFLRDLDAMKELLGAAAANPEVFFERAKGHIVGGLERSKEKRLYVIEDGIPISELDDGFTHMAIEGFESGVMIDADGMLFVGAQSIDGKIFSEKWGLVSETKKDERGREATFFKNDRGQVLFKQLYPGFVIVLNRNLELAKAIARSVTEPDAAHPSEEALGHTLIAPSSAADSTEEEFSRLDFLRMKEYQPSETKSGEKGALLSLREEFYARLADIKFHVKAIDVVEAVKKRLAAEGKTLSEKEKKQAVRKEIIKMEQKVDELRVIIGTLAKDIAKLPEEERTIVMDMAGGAGDLGLAMSEEMLLSGKGLKETQIVDPFSKSKGLDHFMGLIISRLPMSEQLKAKVRQTGQTLQEAEIPPEAIVVAKHACATLSDDIIEKWVGSESPTLCIMTCCQEKAAEYSPRYGFTRAEWKLLCKDSGGTKDIGQDGLDAFIESGAKGNGLSREAFESASLEAVGSETLSPAVWESFWERFMKERELSGSVVAGLKQEAERLLGTSDYDWSSLEAEGQRMLRDKEVKKLFEAAGVPETAPVAEQKLEKKLKGWFWKFWFTQWFKRKKGLEIKISTGGGRYLRGMQAMTSIDGKRLEYLKRRNFDAELRQTMKFPKGDVIVARRKKDTV